MIHSSADSFLYAPQQLIFKPWPPTRIIFVILLTRVGCHSVHMSHVLFFWVASRIYFL